MALAETVFLSLAGKNIDDSHFRFLYHPFAIILQLAADIIQPFFELHSSSYRQSSNYFMVGWQSHESKGKSKEPGY